MNSCIRENHKISAGLQYNQSMAVLDTHNDDTYGIINVSLYHFPNFEKAAPERNFQNSKKKLLINKQQINIFKKNKNKDKDKK